MNLRMVFEVTERSRFVDVAALLIRLVGGGAFMLHGWGKIQKPFTWMGTDSWAPGVLQALAAFSEFGGGLAWILGLLAPLASLGIACTMSVAIWTHAVLRGDPFVGKGGPSYELAAIYFCIALLLIAIGPGRFSLDRLFFGGSADDGGTTAEHAHDAS